MFNFHSSDSSSKHRSSSGRRASTKLIILGLVPLLGVGVVVADWVNCIPADTQATYVGGKSCVECHQEEADKWRGSHHDLAMDLATSETVLGDFNNREIEHHGIVSKMYRDGDRFMVSTEGDDGKISEFEVKYVFGVEPLQQYMVEFDRPANMPENEIARLQVLRISWNIEKKEWFYLAPPDVAEKLEPNDPLHWTRSAQNWNHMCASCHSTNLKKNFDVASKTYHTTFSDIDVNCEACHGPGSVHVDLAKATSFFWDRNFGYGLREIKGKSHQIEVQTCAACHSRRRVVYPNDELSTSFYDCFSNSLLQPQTYYADGQVKDEVYVYGSFIQSKMYHKQIKCTDCHDPHTARLKHEGNKVCTSCHQHTPAKYDNTGHHFHPVGTTGASCAECHMPETPFMDIDLRRDHSLRVPRPDLSVSHDTPNACTGCHLDKKNVDASKHETLQHYSQWLALRDTDPEIDREIRRVDQWATEWIEKWYGAKERPKHFADALGPAWKSADGAEEQLKAVISSRTYPAIARASAMLQLLQMPNSDIQNVARRGLKDADPQVRATAIGMLETADRRTTLEAVQPLLADKERMVRIEAARVLAVVPVSALHKEFQPAMIQALQDYQTGLLQDSDQAAAHMSLGLLAERLAAAETQARQAERVREAVTHYQNAIRVQPDVTGPRSNLAALFEQFGQADEVSRLRAEELKLLARDATMAPEAPAIQYRYGLSLYLNGSFTKAEAALAKASELAPENTQFRFMYALLLEKLGRLDDSLREVEAIQKLQPQNPQFQILKDRLLQAKAIQR